jgi:hypothetical protein
MSGPLTIEDYPLIVVGAYIYRRTESSPLAILATPELANDICARLNTSLTPAHSWGKIAISA